MKTSVEETLVEDMDERDAIETLRKLHEHHHHQQQEPRQSQEDFPGIDAGILSPFKIFASS